MSNSEITVFAQTNFRNQQRKFGIKVDDRRRHMYLIGKTGMGKSTVLENMVINDIRSGEGLALVDPHGDLAEKILKFIPTSRVNDVIYFNPSDTDFPIAFNILENISDDYKHLVAYGLVGVFKKIWADSWGPRMEYILTNTILALLDYPGSTLLGVMRMLVDKQYRKKVVAKVQDPVIKTFWADEFNNYSEKFRTEAIAPIQNKIGQFLSSSIIRNIVGQSKSTIEMRQLMDEQKILIINLSKGRVGEENSALLGAMMITKLQIAAMSRVDIPEDDRKDFFLYVDEFQNFATDSFAGILSEARKYRLCLIMAHQYIEQLSDMVKAAVFGNVGTLIVFRVGATDAAEFELEFAPQFTPQDIVNLNKYTFCLRLMIDGVATEPFSAMGLAPFTQDGPDNSDKVIKVSRERYARPRHIVEDRIIRWSGVELERPAAPKSDDKNLKADDTDDMGDNPDDDFVEHESNQAPVASPLSSTTEKPKPTPPVAREAGLAKHSSMLIGPQNFIPDVGGDSTAKQPPTEVGSPFPVEPTVSVNPDESSAEPMLPPRPRINFAKITLPDVDDSVQITTEPEPIAPTEVEAIPDNTQVDMSSHRTELMSEVKPEQKTEVPAEILPSESEPVSRPEPMVKIESQPEITLEPKIAEPIQQKSETPSISLSDLKQGQVPQVAFNSSGHTPNGLGASTEGDSNGAKKRKRRRRKKSSDTREGSDSSGPMQSRDGSNRGNSPSVQPTNQAPSSVPQKPQTPPDPSPKTKVNINDLL